MWSEESKSFLDGHSAETETETETELSIMSSQQVGQNEDWGTKHCNRSQHTGANPSPAYIGAAEVTQLSQLGKGFAKDSQLSLNGLRVFR